MKGAGTPKAQWGPMNDTPGRVPGWRRNKVGKIWLSPRSGHEAESRCRANPDCAPMWPDKSPVRTTTGCAGHHKIWLPKADSERDSSRRNSRFAMESCTAWLLVWAPLAVGVVEVQFGREVEVGAQG